MNVQKPVLDLYLFFPLSVSSMMLPSQMLWTEVEAALNDTDVEAVIIDLMV